MSKMIKQQYHQNYIPKHDKEFTNNYTYNLTKPFITIITYMLTNNNDNNAENVKIQIK